MGTEAMRVGSVYRRLLKAANKHIGKDGGKRHFRDFISQEFRKNSALSDQEAACQKLKLASNYTYLIDSVHHHQVVLDDLGEAMVNIHITNQHALCSHISVFEVQKDLLFSYNIAVDRSNEMRKILNKSASSVGLRLPDAYQP